MNIVNNMIFERIISSRLYYKLWRSLNENSLEKLTSKSFSKTKDDKAFLTST